MKAAIAARARQQNLLNDANAQQAFDKKAADVQAGGYKMTEDLVRRMGDTNAGLAQGQKTFIDDPRMQQILGQFQERAKGYDSSVLGGIRQEARGQIAGQQQAAERHLANAAARGGVGGARGAAMQGQAALQGAAQGASAERGMALDNANMQMKQGSELSDFMLKQQMAKAGMGAAFGMQGASDNAAQQAAKANSGGGGGGCCFIFLEARYGNGTMDEVVRKFRNENMNEINRRGYYKLSEVLVPLMRKSKLAKGLVRLFMTDPLVAYGKAHYGTGSKLGFIFTPVKNFWLKAFEYLGGEHEFIRENGEVV